MAASRRILPSKAGLAEAGRWLRDGRLVAFPTETVYGLGANALDDEAVRSIFRAKGRPLTDPVIVHVPDTAKALELLDLDAAARTVFVALAERFWPGPLTIIAKARASVPLTVSAGTGYIGTRVPSHPIARALLVEANVPVAAPSANRFGHVSPTSCAHVLVDLGEHGILALDGEAAAAAAGESGGGEGDGGASTCSVGIESTVAKLDMACGELVILRRGGVSEASLRDAVCAMPWEGGAEGRTTMRLRVQSKAVPMDTTAGQVSPGQHVTHYAPDVRTFLVSALLGRGVGGAGAAAEALSGAAAPDTGATELGALVAAPPLAACVLLDCGAQLAALAPAALAYRDLSAAADSVELAQCLFDGLRWAEQVAGAETVLVMDCDATHGAHTAAVHDRMFRAASGVRVVAALADGAVELRLSASVS